MADEEDYAGPNGSMDGEGGPESLAEFLAEGDAHEGEGSLEGDDGADPKGTKAKPDDDRGDDEGASGATEDGKAKDPRAESHSRMVRKLAVRERELTEQRGLVRERERRIQELEQRIAAAERVDDDDLSLLRGRAARRLGVKPEDPKVSEYLFELSRDMTLDHLGDAVNADPELKRIRDERAADRKRRDERRELESRIERMEREKLEAQRQAQVAGAHQAVGQFLTQNATSHPFLMAQTDVDPTETVTELALEAIRTGQANVTDDASGARLLALIAQNLDKHYRTLAETLSKKLNPTVESGGDDIVDKTERAGKAKKQAQGKRTGATGTGGGGRGTPRGPSKEDEPEEDFRSFMRREIQREQSLNRGRR